MSDSDCTPRLISQPEVLRALLQRIRNDLGDDKTAPAFNGALCQLIMKILDSDDVKARYEAVLQGGIWSNHLPGFPKDRFARALLDSTKRYFSIGKVEQMRALSLPDLSRPEKLSFWDELQLLQTSIEVLFKLKSAEGMEISRSLEAASGGLVKATIGTHGDGSMGSKDT